MKLILQYLISILFFAGFLTGFFGIASMKYDLLADVNLLYGYAGLFTILGSFLTPFIIKYVDKPGLFGYLQEVLSHCLLNISVIGTNGLFLFLLINSWGIVDCQKSDYKVLEWKNTTHKMKYSADYEAWMSLKSENGDTLLLRFDNHLSNAPIAASLCHAKGNLGLWLIKDRVIRY